MVQFRDTSWSVMKGCCDSEHSQEMPQSTVPTLHDNYTHIYNNPSGRETVQDIKKQSKKTWKKSGCNRHSSASKVITDWKREKTLSPISPCTWLNPGAGISNWPFIILVYNLHKLLNSNPWINFEMQSRKHSCCLFFRTLLVEQSSEAEMLIHDAD